MTDKNKVTLVECGKHDGSWELQGNQYAVMAQGFRMISLTLELKYGKRLLVIPHSKEDQT